VALTSAPSWVGRSIAELDLRNRYGVSVVAAGHGTKLTAPQLRTPLGLEDRMVVAGRREDLARMRAEAAGAPGP
jgi:K+/H+ antiporter YhaU regulatory subunit KhtT